MKKSKVYKEISTGQIAEAVGQSKAGNLSRHTFQDFLDRGKKLEFEKVLLDRIEESSKVLEGSGLEENYFYAFKVTGLKKYFDFAMSYDHRAGSYCSENSPFQLNIVHALNSGEPLDLLECESHIEDIPNNYKYLKDEIYSNLACFLAKNQKDREARIYARKVIDLRLRVKTYSEMFFVTGNSNFLREIRRIEEVGQYSKTDGGLYFKALKTAILGKNQKTENFLEKIKDYMAMWKLSERLEKNKINLSFLNLELYISTDKLEYVIESFSYLEEADEGMENKCRIYCEILDAFYKKNPSFKKPEIQF